MERIFNKEELWFFTFLNDIGYGVIAVKHDGSVIYLNARAESLTGWKHKQAVGKSLNEIFMIICEAGDDQFHYPLQVFKGKHHKTRQTDNAKLFNKDGSVIPVDIHMTSIGGDRSRVKGQFIVFRDISEAKRTEEMNQDMKTQLIQAQKMSALGKLAGGVAHDFNNLLTIIHLVTDMGLVDNGKDNHPFLSDLKQIKVAAERAAKLTRQLLLYSRKRSTNPVFLNINTTIQSLLMMLQRLLGASITVTARLKPELWTIFADEGFIEQIIMNLLINARDAMPSGGEITVKSENVSLTDHMLKLSDPVQHGDYVCLSIKDTGIGMSRQKCQRIFESFYSDKKQGTGLGLSVVYDIVQQLNGYIEVKSRVGKGSTFKIYLPVALKETNRQDEELKFQMTLQGNHERILMVEDEESLRNLIARVLRQYGFDVVTAPDVNQALNIFEKEDGKFNLLLSDVMLPDGNGLELIDRLKTTNPNLPVLLSSGNSDSKWYWAEIKKRGFPLLHKPYTIPVLLQNVKKAMFSQNKQ